MKTFIVQGQVYTPGEVIADGVVVVEDGRIAAVGPRAAVDVPPHARLIDAAGQRVIPGLIDLHIHGLLEASARSDVAGLAEALPRCAVTGFLPTLGSSSPGDTLQAVRDIATAIQSRPPGARILGIHLEGPYVSPRRPGAMEPFFVRPFSWEEFQTLQAAAQGHIRLLTLAPEVPPARQYIPQLVAQGVIVAIGHSDATYEEAREAIRLGVSHATHIFNATRPFHHREPGIVGAILLHPGVTAQVIGDGEHVHPAAIALLVRAKGAPGVALVSDAMPLAGLPPGEYVSRGKRLLSNGRAIRLPEGQLVGSATLLNGGLRTLVEQVGLSWTEALTIAAVVPAGVLGLPTGRLESGLDADLVIMNDDYQPRLTMVQGQVVYRSHQESSTAELVESN
jgi:N-acetylglucosamine-6-phosphate deacetylase